jgi:hypothetical protein
VASSAPLTSSQVSSAGTHPEASRLSSERRLSAREGGAVAPGRAVVMAESLSSEGAGGGDYSAAAVADGDRAAPAFGAVGVRSAVRDTAPVGRGTGPGRV